MGRFFMKGSAEQTAGELADILQRENTYNCSGRSEKFVIAHHLQKWEHVTMYSRKRRKKMATLNFNQDQCILCGQCVEKCPFGALEILDNKIEINASCKMCKLCVKSCPVQAVSLVEDAVKQTVDKDAWKGVMVFVEQEESGIHPVAFEADRKSESLLQRSIIRCMRC